MSRNILLVVTSNDRLGDNGGATGTWLEELASAYYTFVDAGHAVSIASTRGGDAPLDPGSLQEPWLTETGRRFQQDARATAALRDTLPIDRAKAAYDAVYLVGGAGTAWDFPGSAGLTALIETLDRSGRVVAGVCHGVLGLTTARTKDGKALVAGRAVTGVSNAEERAIGYDKIVPLLPEERMNQLGARYSSAAEPFHAHVVRDGNLLTGQNPASAAPLAAAVLVALGS